MVLIPFMGYHKHCQHCLEGFLNVGRFISLIKTLFDSSLLTTRNERTNSNSLVEYPLWDTVSV